MNDQVYLFPKDLAPSAFFLLPRAEWQDPVSSRGRLPSAGYLKERGDCFGRDDVVVVAAIVVLNFETLSFAVPPSQSCVTGLNHRDDTET